MNRLTIIAAMLASPAILSTSAWDFNAIGLSAVLEITALGQRKE